MFEVRLDFLLGSDDLDRTLMTLIQLDDLEFSSPIFDRIGVDLDLHDVHDTQSRCQMRTGLPYIPKGDTKFCRPGMLDESIPVSVR